MDRLNIEENFWSVDLEIILMKEMKRNIFAQEGKNIFKKLKKKKILNKWKTKIKMNSEIIN